MAEVRIIAAHALSLPAQDSPTRLRERLSALCGEPPRRLNRFTELALIGALGCVRGSSVPGDCALYLGSDRGGAGDTIARVEDTVLRGEPPMPVDFLNVSGSSPGFHLTRALGLAGRSQILSAGAASFEAALDLAWCALARSPGTALVGVVEDASWPLAAHRRRVGLAADAPVRELSAWLLLDSRERASGPILAEPRFHAGLEALVAAPLGGRLSLGAGLPAAERSGLGGSEGAAAEDAAELVSAVQALLSRRDHEGLVRVNGDGRGGYYRLDILAAGQGG